MQIILLGAPGVGKGTQAELIADKYNMPNISTGEILRAEVKSKSPLGKRVKRILANGELVSDELMLQIVEKRLMEPDCLKGFILDGFPRTIPQARNLETILQKIPNKDPLMIINIKVPNDEILNRLMERKRADDTKETIKHRLEVYQENTAPLLGYYSRHQHFHQINGIGSIEDVFYDIVKILNRKLRKK